MSGGLVYRQSPEEEELEQKVLSTTFTREIEDKIKDLQSRFQNSPLGYGGHCFPT
ncbi:MAG: hypothetical protein RLZZ339_242 [Cyanobacteriota bacterium]|jgi:diphthamide synthase (EF-2-diphthine--ammonia ligase)